MIPMNVKYKRTIISLINFTFVYALLCVSEVQSDKLNIIGEKLSLKPTESVDLAMEEHQRPGKTSIKHDETNEELDNKFVKEAKKAAIIDEVNVGALARKVWSRWSKWGQCSVTCGQGTKTRRRFCLSGRCGPGEREEQRLPCYRQQCELY